MAEPFLNLSRAISQVLRHTARQLGLEPDGQGWVDLDALVEALRAERGVADLTAADVIQTTEKGRRRCEVVDGRIRALYGHSFPLGSGRTLVVPPAKLFHGTVRSAVPSIARFGLRPQGRQYVHLATSSDLAELIGRRRDTAPVVLVADARAAHAAGVPFHRATDEIYLAGSIAPRFVTPIADGPRA